MVSVPLGGDFLNEPGLTITNLTDPTQSFPPRENRLSCPSFHVPSLCLYMHSSVPFIFPLLRGKKREQGTWECIRGKRRKGVTCHDREARSPDPCFSINPGKKGFNVPWTLRGACGSLPWAEKVSPFYVPCPDGMKTNTEGVEDERVKLPRAKVDPRTPLKTRSVDQRPSNKTLTGSPGSLLTASSWYNP